MAPEKRTLAFENLDEVLDDARTLLAEGYRTSGKWNLSQVCQHLDDWMRFPMDGYPTAPAPIRVMLWLMKSTVGRRQLRSILSSGFRNSTPTMPQTVHEADTLSDADAVDQLAATIERFKQHNGPLVESPVFGHTTPDEALKLQLRHCEHHLSFLSPTD